jgi:hypothetical protein
MEYKVMGHMVVDENGRLIAECRSSQPGSSPERIAELLTACDGVTIESIRAGLLKHSTYLMCSNSNNLDMSPTELMKYKGNVVFEEQPRMPGEDNVPD